MINLILIFFISLIIGSSIVLISLVLIAYGYVQDIRLAKCIIYYSIKKSLPSQKEKLVDSIQSKLTKELYKKLERISNMSDQELLKDEKIEKTHIMELRIKIDNILKERPKCLISTQQTKDILRVAGAYNFFGIFKILIENYSIDDSGKRKGSNYKQRPTINNVSSKEVLKNLPNDNDLIRSLI